MRNAIKSSAWLLGIIFCAEWLAGVAAAAVQKSEIFSAYTGTGFFNLQSTSIDTYDGNRARHDTEYGRILWKGPEHRIDIENMDLDKQWEIDPKRKRYTECGIKEALENFEKEWKKDLEEAEKKNPQSKENEPPYRVKVAKTTVAGPGAAVTLNGFTARPYTVKTVIEYETSAGHQPFGRQTLFAKEWTSDDPRLSELAQHEAAVYQSTGPAFGAEERNQLQGLMQKEIAKAQSDPASNPWLQFWLSVDKLHGQPVRSITVLSGAPGYPEAAKTTASDDPHDDSLVQPGDLSNGVGGLLSGIAGHLATNKINRSVEKKMAERPAWVDEVSGEINRDVPGFAYLLEVKSVKTDGIPADLFEIPAGYKKVKSL